MAVRNLEFLFSPKSIALVGASPKPGSVGRVVAANLRTGGFSDPIWLVNPRHSEIEGVPCFSSVSQLPGGPDATVLNVTLSLDGPSALQDV